MDEINLDDWKVIAEGVNPDAAIKFWQERARLTWDEAKELVDGAKARAFYVTGLAQQDLVRLVSDGLEEALKNGETMPQFRERILKAIENQGWKEYRVETIFRTNMQTAYSAGRYLKMQAVKKTRPYWQYVATMDRKTRPSHAILNGLVYHANHEFWQHNFPPNGFRCRCDVITLSEREVDEQGLTVEKEMPKPGVWTDPKTGMEHFVHFPGADKGFRNNPFKEWASGKLTADLKDCGLDEGWDYAEARRRPALFGEWVKQIAAKKDEGMFHARGERSLVGELSETVLAYLATRNIQLATHQISVGDDDILHGLRSNKVRPLPVEVWARLPELLKKPLAIYWDKLKPGLIYILEDGSGKFVVLVDYQAKVERKTQLVNTVRTGAEVESLQEFENRGRYDRIK